MVTMFTVGLLDVAGWIALKHIVSSSDEYSNQKLALILSLFAIDFWLFVAFFVCFLRLG